LKNVKSGLLTKLPCYAKKDIIFSGVMVQLIYIMVGILVLFWGHGDTKEASCLNLTEHIHLMVEVIHLNIVVIR